IDRVLELDVAVAIEQVDEVARSAAQLLAKIQFRAPHEAAGVEGKAATDGNRRPGMGGDAEPLLTGGGVNEGNGQNRAAIGRIEKRRAGALAEEEIGGFQTQTITTGEPETGGEAGPSTKITRQIVFIYQGAGTRGAPLQNGDFRSAVGERRQQGGHPLLGYAPGEAFGAEPETTAIAAAAATIIKARAAIPAASTTTIVAQAGLAKHADRPILHGGRGGDLLGFDGDHFGFRLVSSADSGTVHDQRRTGRQDSDIIRRVLAANRGDSPDVVTLDDIVHRYGLGQGCNLGRGGLRLGRIRDRGWLRCRGRSARLDGRGGTPLELLGKRSGGEEAQCQQ